MNDLSGLLSSMPLIVNLSSGIHCHIIHLSERCYIFSSASHKQAVYWSIAQKISATPIVTRTDQLKRFLMKASDMSSSYTLDLVSQTGIDRADRNLANSQVRERRSWSLDVMISICCLWSLSISMYESVQHGYRCMTSEGTDGENKKRSVRREAENLESRNWDGETVTKCQWRKSLTMH